MTLTNFQTRIPEEVREQFRQARDKAGAFSDGETLGILIKSYLKPEESQESDVLNAEKETVQLEEVTDNLMPEIQSDVIIPMTSEQREIISKCYDDPENLGEEILKTLIQVACQYVKTREGFGIFDRYERFFITKGVEFERFKSEFKLLIEALEAENHFEL